jgi:hypothetical protein
MTAEVPQPPQSTAPKLSADYVFSFTYDYGDLSTGIRPSRAIALSRERRHRPTRGTNAADCPRSAGVLEARKQGSKTRDWRPSRSQWRCAKRTGRAP